MTSTTATPAEQGPVLSAAGPVVPARLSIGEALRGTHNSLGFIRLVLASLVIFDHAFPLGGYGEDPFWQLTRGQASLGSFAVAGFFAISGYLIAKSGMTADVVQFMWRRVLRIFPAYWGALLIAAFAIGPVIWVLDGHAFADYFSFGQNGPFHYFAVNWTLNIGTYGIYDLYAETTPYGRSIGESSALNGSLWTLIYEWTCYLIIGALVAFGVLIRARIVVPLLTGLVVALQIVFLVDPAAVGVIFPFFADPYRLNLTMTFLFGSCIAVYSRDIPFDDRLGVLSGLLMVLTLRYGGFTIIGLAAGAYFVLYLGARLGGPLRRVGTRNDYSYGVYVYGFLVQQTLAYFGVHEWGYVPFVLAALLVSFGLAWLSWHGVEKRAMALKDWGPGLGWRHWYDRIRDRRAAGRQTPKEETEE